MQKSELIGAFKTGVQTGHSIEDIKQSLINAGYSRQDVEDSVSAFSQGRTTPPAKPLPSPEKEKVLEEGKFKKMPLYFWIALVASAVIVLGLVGYIIYRLIG